ncbi:unnamed protein product [Fraxinus pennsylvanica]|uniref:AB hydrolase-1 domain-containing protein n=1 Tax=Fraxinus pennsylvanica TaxID=56036 RepID=A0AAD1ZBM5_9LAMI|nr:unnamed protein product [Fraxinus pennsylvanica]
MEGKKQQKHFVLVHGVCHGAWCWYRLQSLLEAEGHRVTAIDLAASGINPKKLDELHTFSDYTQPLFEISVAIFITAIMPDTVHKPSYFIEQGMEDSSEEDSTDNQIIPFGKPEDHRVAMLFGPHYTSSKLYQLCPYEDVVLAKALMRPGYTFLEDLSKQSAFSEERYGSIKRAYIIPDQDKTLTVEFQRWLIENSGASIVKEMKDADHMAMISKPHELCQYLLDIAWEGKVPHPSPAKDFIALSLPQFPLKEGNLKIGHG